ncbi:hypothetical protein [Roseateles sp. BYS87W]|uniref:Uncharacterized protein n=1 Tax=Pelomonas baiyunensis TaxID=3299026 RepID=A0ABW7GYG6_9BURK
MPKRDSGDDLDKIAEVLLEFFDDKRVIEALDKVHEFGVSGWEKWWQVELALFLSHADDKIAEWDMEHPFDTDRRTKLGQSRMALDIGFRLKRQAKDQWYFVELKQADDYRACIDRMCKDANKVFSARKQSFDGLSVRYVACAGVFRGADEKDVETYLSQACDREDIEVDGFYYEKLCDGYKLLIF